MSINNQKLSTMFTRIDTLTQNGNVQTADVKNELTNLFVKNGAVNENKAGATKINAKIEALNKRIGELEAKAAEIQEEIEEKNSKLQSRSGELSEIAGELASEQTTFQSNCVDAARLATRDAIVTYRKNKRTSFEQCFNQAFQKRIGDLSASQSTIKTLYAQYQEKSGGITSIAKDIETAINSIDSLNSQLKTTQATITLLSMTKTRMEQSTEIANAYQNVDTNAAPAIYSAEKAAIADEILSSIGAKPTAAPQGQGEGKPVRDEQALKDTMAQYAALNEGTGYNATWHATLDKNPQLQNLNARMQSGMVEDLLAKGATGQEILTFVSETWQVGIRQNADGSWFIPDNEAAKATVFDPLANLAGAPQPKVAEVSPENLASLQNKGLEALDKMYKAGFTFKEAMGVMMQAFPDSGIVYDLNSQAGGRNYQISADSDASNGIYGQISEKILQCWNVGAEQMMEPGEDITIQRGHSDPISFQSGDTTYTFITDRNDNGKFDFTDGDNNDLLGSKDGLAELTKFDYNNDGVIDANDVDADGNKALDQLMLMGNKQTESVDTQEEVDGYKNGPSYTNTVDFDVTYSTAADLGITKIDLSRLNNHAEGEKVDMNGTQTIADFSITMNGNEYQAKETLNTDENLNIFYGQIAQKGGGAAEMKVKLTEEDVTKALNGAEGSKKIDAVKARLLEIKDESAEAEKKLGNLELIDEQTITTLTDSTFLTGVRDTARAEAKKHINDQDEAADAVEEAVDEYFEEKGVGDKKDNKDDKKDNK